MKQVCQLCQQTAPDRNLFCPEIYCPAEQSPTVFEYGERLADLEIIKPVVITRAATLYEANHQGQKVLAKVAQVGDNHVAKLIREAQFLQQFQLHKQRCAFLPTLRPPYINSKLGQVSYGKAMRQGIFYHYYLFDFVEGEPLRDILTQNPELWVSHVGWVVTSLAYTIDFLHQRGLLHYGLTPETILVHFERKQPKVPRILLVDLGIAANFRAFTGQWYDNFVPPAYLAPELINRRQSPNNEVTDVYGLGLILYEMLAGKPFITAKFRNEATVRTAVGQGQSINLHRTDLKSDVVDLTRQALNSNPARRPKSIKEIESGLVQLFGKVPQPKQRRWPSLSTILVVVSALLAVAMVIALALQPGLMAVVVAIILIIIFIVYQRNRK